MAKLKDLAGLAALGMLGYKLSQGKGEQENKGRLSDKARPESTETRLESPQDTIKRSTKKAPLDSTEMYPSGVMGGAKLAGTAQSAPASEPAPAPAKPQAAKPKVTTPVMSSAQNTALANANQQAKLKAESDALAKANQKAKTTTVVKKTPAATTTPTSSAKPLPANKPAPPVTTSSNRVPTPEQAEANRQALYDKVKGFGSSVVDAVTNFETPAERAARERKAASGMKRGGTVKKMVSGGMTSKVSSASSRADGIASRGKTRCKMY